MVDEAKTRETCSLKKKREQMRHIRDEVMGLTDSPLYEYRTSNNYFPVLGEGSHDADIMLIGEAPGKNEALTGRPFCGAAGKVLDELLEHVSLDRNDVYITNILKDRPPNNRDPYPEEVEVYGPFLDRQIEVIQPKVIATLGRHAMTYIMKKFGLDVEIDPISRAHGKVYEAKTLFGTNVTIVPLYHPAVAVYNSNSKDDLKKDMEVLKEVISS